MFEPPLKKTDNVTTYGAVSYSRERGRLPLASMTRRKSPAQHMKRALVVMSVVLAACSATVPATMRIERHQILRGSASGKVGKDAVISVKSREGLSCTGKMFVPVTETTTEGTIQCNDKRKGNFLANGKGDSWAAEGKLNDGTKFLILLGTKRTPLEY